MYNLHQVLRQVESSDDTGDENSSPENTTKKSAKSAKADNSKLNGCVNFIHNDIDEAKSTVRTFHLRLSRTQ